MQVIYERLEYSSTVALERQKEDSKRISRQWTDEWTGFQLALAEQITPITASFQDLLRLCAGGGSLAGGGALPGPASKYIMNKLSSIYYNIVYKSIAEPPKTLCKSIALAGGGALAGQAEKEKGDKNAKKVGAEIKEPDEDIEAFLERFQQFVGKSNAPDICSHLKCEKAKGHRAPVCVCACVCVCVCVCFFFFVANLSLSLSLSRSLYLSIYIYVYINILGHQDSICAWRFQRG